MPTIEQASQWYPKNDPVHGLDHVLRVTRMAEQLALAEGADLEIVRAAALLHDAEGSAPHVDNHRANHHEASALLFSRFLSFESIYGLINAVTIVG